MKKSLLFFLVIVFFNLNIPASAINIYKYPEKDLSENFCLNILEKLNNPTFPYSKKEPYIVKVDLKIEDIHKISGKDLDFETSYSMWLYWKDDNLIKVLKEFEIFTNKGKPIYLCDYSPNSIIGEKRKIFDPVIEFFNLKEKPNFETGLQDWIEIFSDGTVQSRIRDTKVFKGISILEISHLINKVFHLIFGQNFQILWLKLLLMNQLCLITKRIFTLLIQMKVY